MRKHLLLCLGTVIAASYATDAQALDWVGQTLNGEPCEGTGQGFGPYDYFDINDATDPLYREGRYWEMDEVHTDRARRLMDDVSAGTPMTQGNFQLAILNLDYSLRAVPNDPRSLRYMIELDEIRRSNETKLISSHPPPECYFQRAIKFRPRQAHIRLLYGIYLDKRGHYEGEVKQYEQALKINDMSAEAHYNLGLALVKLDRFKEAVPHARRAYQLGFPLPGLKSILLKSGYDIDSDQ